MFDTMVNGGGVVQAPKLSADSKSYEAISVGAVSLPTGNLPVAYKYNEGRIIADFQEYIDRTYREHYKTDDQTIECFDAWIALGDSMPTFRNTALKYLWRYGKKKGSNKDDLMKVLHYTLMMLHVDHYKKGE
jgi:hypothetical protein